MTFLANIGVAIVLFFSSLWGGALGLLHLQQNPVSTIATTTTDIQNIHSPDGKSTDFWKDSSYIYISMGTDGWEPYAGDTKPLNFDAEYTNSTFVTGVDVASFVAMHGFYFKDKNRVYWQDMDLFPIPNADQATFVSFSVRGLDAALTYDAQDKNHKYLSGQIVQ